MADKNETYAIVGCGNSPSYQVWGARSDLGCRKRKRGMLNMKFSDWIAKRRAREKNGR